MHSEHRFYRLAAIVLIAALLGFSDPNKSAGQAADQANSKAKINVSNIGRDACAALVIQPRRMAQSPIAAELLKDQAIADGVKKLGISPTEVEQIILVAPYPEMPEAGAHLEYAPTVIMHFTHATDAKAIVVKHREAMGEGPVDVSEKQLDGKTYYVFGSHAAAFNSNATTVIFSSERGIKKAISAGEQQGPLVERLQKIDADNCAVAAIAFDDFPNLGKHLDAAENGAPPIVKTYLDALRSLHGAQATLNLHGDSFLHLTLDATSAEAADDTANLLDQAMTMARGGMALVKSQLPAEQKKTLAGVLKIADDVVASASTKKDASQVDFTLKLPANFDAALPQTVATLKSMFVAVRTDQQRMQQMNNLKQIALAMINYCDTYGHFPSSAIEKDGKRLLSWRVAILPYIEEDNLYRRFHLDEPWDSPHNLELAKKMPQVFRSPGRPIDNKTTLMVFTGKDTAFDGGKSIRPVDITDGMSNTILAVEAGADKAVVWTKPDDLPFDPAKPLAALGQIPADGFHVTMFDGSVRRLKVDDATLKAMVTPAGGELVPGQ